MLKIFELNNSKESRMLKFLFFSTSANVQDDHLNIKILKIKSRYKNKLYIYMKIIINFNVHEQILIFRIQKNEFLSHFINDKYYCVFKMLSHHSEFFCLT